MTAWTGTVDTDKIRHRQDRITNYLSHAVFTCQALDLLYISTVFV
jgi:hypothetical protein